jgi:hypothetical protein
MYEAGSKNDAGFLETGKAEARMVRLGQASAPRSIAKSNSSRAGAGCAWLRGPLKLHFARRFQGRARFLRAQCVMA